MLLVILFLFVGMIIGWFASLLFEGSGLDGPGDVIVGIVGALAGGFTYSSLEMAPNGFWGAAAMATLGSILLLFIASLLFGPTEQLH
jgi:uncharacterized membrane protein YeaQ/YmgE (transglycosylase-associated protein family)